jgi:RNA polymerase sigma-32 factor
LLTQAMAVLNDREKDVLMQRRLADDPVTLEELSESYGVSRERIRQIEVRAFEKLQARMRDLARGKGMLVPV